MLRLRFHFLTALLLLSVALIGCDASLNDVPDHTDEVEQATQEALAYIEQVTQTYDDALAAAKKSGNYVYVSAGSNNALADALAQAGPNGVVVLAAGTHTEDDTVPITHPVLLIGEPGSKLLVDTQPKPIVPTLDPALHVMDARKVVIWGLEILPQAAQGGTAILAERAPQLIVGRTTISEHQYGVVFDRTEHATIANNAIAVSGDPYGQVGILTINGPHAKIVGNEVSGALAGIFASHVHGRLIGNTVSNNLHGVIFCKSPGVPAPSGEELSADITSSKWLASHNHAQDNVWGFLVIDDANQNLIASTNTASNNAMYDVELTGDSNRFGFFTPFSHNNRVFAGNPSLTVKDCGVNNRVHGGMQVDIGADPCF